MSKNTGHVIRISGLLIEMLGIWGVFTATAENDRAHLQLPGGAVVPLAWIAVGLGFVLWLTGTLLVYKGRPGRKSRRLDEDDRRTENMA
jgi:hypothetical protein